MDMIRALLRPRTEITIPHFNEDDKVDLLVKALFYMYRRIDMLQGYQASGGQPQGIEVQVDGLSQEDLDNLDKMYNKLAFIQVVYLNKHRVLTDWPRNKFRSLLLLSHTPQMEQIPDFPTPGFKFSVLSPESSNDEYVKTLSESDIYFEHNLPLQLRRNMAETLLRRYPVRDLKSRASIISEYVELLAIEVQVARLYKAALHEGKSPSPLATPLGSPMGSPRAHTNASNPNHYTSPHIPSNGLSSPTRATRIRPEEPREPKLASKPSLSGLRLSQTLKGGRSIPAPQSPTYQASKTPTLSPTRVPLRASRSSSPVRSPVRAHIPPQPSTQSPPSSPGRKLRLKASTQNLRDAPNLALSQEPKKVLLDQSRLAVQARLVREEQIIQNI